MATEATDAPAFSTTREVATSYGFPIAMFMAAIIPGCNYSYSGHGGFSWFIIPLCFPFVTVRALIKCTIGTAHSLRWYRRFFVFTIPSYIAVAFPLSWAATSSIEHTFGLHIPAFDFFRLMVSPFPWWYLS